MQEIGSTTSIDARRHSPFAYLINSLRTCNGIAWCFVRRCSSIPSGCRQCLQSRQINTCYIDKYERYSFVSDILREIAQSRSIDHADSFFFFPSFLNSHAYIKSGNKIMSYTRQLGMIHTTIGLHPFSWWGLAIQSAIDNLDNWAKCRRL